jgi:anaerobic ribonucleoside-triphosphate reductase
VYGAVMSAWKEFLDFLKWMFVDDTEYVRICSRCHYIQADEDGEACIICGENTVLISEGRAKIWKQEIEINRMIDGE